MNKPTNQTIDVAAIYFPSWHVDPKNEKLHGKGWTEWELVKNAKPLYPGHYQPRIPTMGYFDEASLEYAEKQIDLAADHGVNVFHVDWYWYDDSPFLNRPFDEALLKASNNKRIKFGLMWANHDWKHIFPLPRTQRPQDAGIIYPSVYDKQVMDHVIEEWIHKYFSHSQIWRIDGKAVVTIYNLDHMVERIGVEGAKRLIERMENRLAQVGLPSIHWNAMGDYRTVQDQLKELGILSASNYQTIWDPTNAADMCDPQSVFDPRTPKCQDYVKTLDLAEAHWEMMTNKLNVPYYPILTQGWDSSPRGEQFDGHGQQSGYPWYPIVENNTPENFEKAAVRAREFVLRQPMEHKVVFINAWNEWTEGSYLLPDERYGTAYLKAIKNVFGANKVIAQ